ncbi:hypothetical protein RHCH11_RHCH11_03899 [Beijerinckiaceae bacterium RH CH11]|nr:hypothetical protein RHCH11_RHCH11_03899 [Beijerinckiaceae bacterium RH CH11]VVB49786.1 hypothetical protein RHAL8_03895 [Beijerinckiaceae bacterium RH AL8]
MWIKAIELTPQLRKPSLAYQLVGSSSGAVVKPGAWAFTPARANERTRARPQLWPGAMAVTARRFCDQQEMSLQVATGRSLP